MKICPGPGLRILFQNLPGSSYLLSLLSPVELAYLFFLSRSLGCAASVFLLAARKSAPI